MDKILVIIPAFNEEKNIGSVIKKIKKSLPKADILVVDDGSTDQTVLLASSHRVSTVSHPFNMGYGVALQTGYKYAKENSYDFICQIDADGQHEPSFLPSLLLPIQTDQCDIVIGSRFLNERYDYPAPIGRLLGMKLFGWTASIIIKQKVTDPTSGFQAFNKEVVKFLILDSFPADFPDADVLIMLHFAGFRIKELPVKMYSSSVGKSIHQGLKPVYYLFKMFLSICLTLLREKKNYKIKK